MKIKAKLMWTLIGMSMLVTVVGALAVNRQRAVALLGATTEDEDVARIIALTFAADEDPSHGLTKKVIRRLHETLGRDVEVIDSDKRILADAIPEEVGTIENDLGDDLDKTLRDGRARTFVEISRDYPQGIRQIAVPVRTESGRVLGAVILEYTPLYNEMMALTTTASREVVSAALASAVIALLLALYIGTSISVPLRQLTTAAAGFAAGETGLSMPAPRRDEIGDLIAAFNIMMETRQQAKEALLRTRDELARERERLANILNNVPAVVFEYWSREKIGRNFVSNQVEKMFGYTPQEWTSTPDFWALSIHPDDKDRVLAEAAHLSADEGSDCLIQKCRWMTKDQRIIWGESHITVIRNPSDGTQGILGFTLDITEQKRAEEEFEKMHEQLIEASRHAGMAEVATNVLHNVGNVLNSVNISAALAADHIRKSSAPHLGRVVSLLRQNAAAIGDFMALDPVGRKLPGFLEQLAGQLESEGAAALKELEQLEKNVEHVKDIVAVQQNYASAAGVSQTVAIADLVEDSLRMNAGALMRHQVELVREFETQVVIQVDKHKVMQILVNLIRNAKYACDESGRREKRLTVRITNDERIARIAIIDNGVGIPAANLTRIFSHGFTTRESGHGFGLHSSALAATELGGALLVHSDGPDLGAVFTLELPLKTPKA